MTTMTPSKPRARVGDWLGVDDPSGHCPCCGQVVQVLEGDERYLVRWADQHESIFHATPDTAVIRRLPSRAARR